MESYQKIRVTALAATILALAAGSVMAQDRSEREDRERRARSLQSVLVEPTQVVVSSARRARLGVYPDTDQGREVDARGARIRGVVEDGPADEAGLEEGDIIVELNGRSLLESLPDPEDEDDLDPDGSLPIQRLVAIARKLDPGDQVEVVYLRDGERRTTSLTAEAVGLGRIRVGTVPEELERRLEHLRERRGDLRGFFRDDEGRGDEGARGFFWRRDGERPGVYRFFGGEGHPGSFELRSGPMGRCPGAEGGWAMLMDGCVAGVRLVPLNRRLGEYFESDRGVLVADVAEASSLGLEPGDVILSIDGREVDDPADVTRILRSYREGEEVTLRVVRQGDERTVRGTVE